MARREKDTGGIVFVWVADPAEKGGKSCFGEERSGIVLKTSGPGKRGEKGKGTNGGLVFLVKTVEKVRRAENVHIRAERGVKREGGGGEE